MRRRALMAASMPIGDSGEFYCRCVNYHPLTGAVRDDNTYTFVLDRQATWQDCNGLCDTSNSATINVLALPGGRLALFLNEIKEVSTLYSPKNDISVTDYIIFGETYQFEY